MTEIERQLDNNQQIETLYALYQQASSQRDILMTQQVEAWKQLMLANEVIFKAVVNRTHWKRTATRYLKKHAPNFYAQTKSEWENDGVADD
jgi:ATP-dependent protease ClpP protease subunit